MVRSYHLVDWCLSAQNQELLVYWLAQHLYVVVHRLVVEIQATHTIFILSLTYMIITS